ncbi:toll/interleukin-1 receptor domain-containing protein [Providencia rettgeri]|uniref:toll/interleukin-1 receptor domain-containing protein n=1 Tax=Providencia rettgeri TaxID=587 RepID=UPI001B37BA62|nr:toll/interleukin-1 receptor domain-containing protein [Providencia rettgeri]MBQ0329374.1 toll/interleukin-1 receptor domain-containing protein [Providencia rettgeri]
MLHKFNLKIDNESLDSKLLNEDINNYNSLIYNYGQDNLIKEIKSILDIDEEKKEVKIKHTDIIKNWFPESDCHIFMSHSHKDKNIAIKIANYLYANYKIKTFIDSYFWQFVDKAIYEINVNYSKNPKPNDHLLRYDSSLRVGTNFYLTLSNALMDTIDKSDCCIFLNTENSISNINSESESTYSPWIYTELNILDKIRKNPHKDRGIRAGNESYVEKAAALSAKTINESYRFDVEYEVNPSLRLPTISEDIIEKILMSPDEISKNDRNKELKYSNNESDESDESDEILLKLKTISYLDDIYDFINSNLKIEKGNIY